MTKPKAPNTKKQTPNSKEVPSRIYFGKQNGEYTGGVHNKGDVSASATQYAEDPLAAKSIEPGYNDDTVVVARMLQ